MNDRLRALLALQRSMRLSVWGVFVALLLLLILAGVGFWQGSEKARLAYGLIFVGLLPLALLVLRMARALGRRT